MKHAMKLLMNSVLNVNLSPSNFNDFLIKYLINNVGLKEENVE